MHDYTNQIYSVSFFIKQEEAGIIDWHSSKWRESQIIVFFVASGYIYNNNNTGKSSVLNNWTITSLSTSYSCAMHGILNQQETFWTRKHALNNKGYLESNAS